MDNHVSNMCEKHGIRFEDKNKLELHKTECEALLVPNICLYEAPSGETCKKSFKKTGSLIIHYYVEHQQYACAQCYSSYDSSHELEEHAHKESQNLRLSEYYIMKRKFLLKHFQFTGPYSCSKCYSSFATNHHLRLHISNKHRKRVEKECEKDGKKKFQCEICGKSYMNDSSMQRHAKSNHGYSAKQTRGWINND